MKQFSFADIKAALAQTAFKAVGNLSAVALNDAKTLDEASEHSLVWISGKAQDINALASQTLAKAIVCQEKAVISETLLAEKCFILTDNPKMVFSLLVAAFFAKKPSGEIHPTAYVHPEAELAEDVYVGPFTYIGNCKIGAGSVVWGQCFIHDGSVLGKNVEIHVGCIIGDDGSGFARNKEGKLIKFPHIGNTILDDDVEVGANSYINKGALGSTHLKRGVKIGNSVCVGHNVFIDEDAIVIANTVIAGSTRIGKRAYIAPAAVIRNKLKIGTDATVGMGAVVVKDVPDNTTVIGNPAETLGEYRRWSRLKKKLFGKFESPDE